MLNFSKLKDMEILYVILGAAAILAIGLLLIKIITALSKKALMRTGLDESMHKFIINVLKIVLYIIMIVAVSYTHLDVYKRQDMHTEACMISPGSRKIP